LETVNRDNDIVEVQVEANERQTRQGQAGGKP